MITRATLSTIEQGLPKYRSMLAGNTAYAPPVFESIASATPNGTTSVTFSSIPSTYQHLQIRINAVMGTGGGALSMRYNGDTGSNYSRHLFIQIAPSGTYAGGGVGSSLLILGGYDGNVATQPNVVICDIADYAATNKYKTYKTFSGNSDNSTSKGNSELYSGVWQNTSTAINQIQIIAGYNFTSGSVISLYGIKG